MTNKQTAAREDYLKAIFHLGVGSTRVHTTAIAAALSVSKPSVTAMLKRLAQEGLVDYSPRQGVLLTEEGRGTTMRVVRRHRLLETFLVQMLGLDWSEVHEEAEVLEHHLSDRMVNALDRALGHPTEDPHGHSIPDSDGRLRVRDLTPLEQLAVGAEGTVREVNANEPTRLQRWKKMGFLPGKSLAMLERHEFEDVMHIDVDGELVVTGREGVAGILVELKS